MDISDKNIYENIINFADNRTVLQMLSVNKKFADPIFFERVLDRKYPYLKEFKKDDESWRHFFVRMAYYIAKLDEEFGIPYIPTKGYNPEELYNTWNKSKRIYNFAMARAAEGGHLDIVQYLIDEKGANDFDLAMINAAKGGHLGIVKLMIEKAEERNKYIDYIFGMVKAAGGGHLDIVKYIIKKAKAGVIKTSDFVWAISSAEYGGHPEIVNYLKQFV